MTSCNDNNIKKDDKKLKKYSYFGEISLLFDNLCTATISARKYCNLAMLSKLNLNNMMTRLPFIHKALKKGVYDYKDNTMEFTKTCFE